jgi:hypothetical protein
MPDIPPATLAKFKRLQAMRDMAQAATTGASQNAYEAQNAWNENWKVGMHGRGTDSR